MTAFCATLLFLLQFGVGEPSTEVPGLPALAALEQVALRKLGLEDWDYADARVRLRARHWLPSFTVRVSASAWDRASLTDDSASLDYRRSGYGGEVSATWHLAGLAYDDHEIALTREHLQVQRIIAETLTRVRSDVSTFYALQEQARAGNAASHEALLALRQALLGGRAYAQ